MTYNEKKKLCKEINNDPIYQALSRDIVCACYRNVKGAERLEVFQSENPFRFRTYSEPCMRWTEQEIMDWICCATIQLQNFITDEAETFDPFDLIYIGIPFD